VTELTELTKPPVVSAWLELSTVCEPEAADAVAEVFGRWGRGVAIDQPVRDAPDGDGGWVDPARDVVIKTYVPVDERAEEHRRLLEEAVWHLGRLRHVEPLQARTIQEEDWANAWKRFFHPHRVGKRLVIVPSWRRRAREPGDVIIRLDPGMAFGTGLHPTTRMCLMLLEELLRPGDRVVDFGCGSAIISIAAVRLGASRVEALDIDAVAVRVARENVRRNAVARRVHVSAGSLGDAGVGGDEPFDLVVANISALVLERSERAIWAAVRGGGCTILSGVLERDLARVRTAYEHGGWQHLETRVEGDWSAVALRKPHQRAGQG
jgi:ribosomal protein L11 methyltransferase